MKFPIFDFRFVVIFSFFITDHEKVLEIMR